MKLIGFILLLTLSALSLSASVPLTIEHARSDTELQWGLMGRLYLHPDHGMLFHFPKKKILRIWAFNCYIDLSIAFLDEQGRIVQMEDLIAFPEAMDPKRPIRGLKDLQLYANNGPVKRLFREHAVVSKQPSALLLEMNLGWFKKHGIQVGDRLFLTENGSYQFLPFKAKICQ